VRLLTDRSDCLQWAGDASIYHLVPRLVAFPETIADVQALLRRGQPLTFRAGGTSLSGQAISDSILVVVSEHWRGLEVLAGGERVRCGPGVVGAWVNAALAGCGRKLGPDPASLQAAEIGGIVANNASGMCCGIAHNSYRTVEALEVVLADGFHFSTADDAALARARPQLHAGLTALRQRVHADPQLVARIERAFASKNTVGYSLNAFLDEHVPARILQKLLIGSEGTLAFIASATFATIPVAKHRATAWHIYPDIDAACAAVPELAAQAAAIELLDAVSLARVSAKLLEPLPPGEPAALLIELQHDDPFELGEAMRRLPQLRFTSDPAVQARYWAIRKGLFPSVGAVRAAGTAVVIEDVTFPVAELAVGVRALRALFTAHGYADAVLFGHAKDGNLHFTLTPDFSQAGEVSRYAAFMAALAELVLAHGGHLKAEHGTGRNMAPYVRAQWGDEAVAIMHAVKNLLDPLGLLNPGVVLNDDPQAHLRHLKTLPAVDPLIDACIECGFCEPVCPSRDFASSPRQRIQLLRAVARGEDIPDWQARGVESCAGDGLCASACPVHIDTGAVMRQHRARRRGALARHAAAWSARHIAVVTGLTRLALAVVGGRRLPGTAIPLPPVIADPPRALAGTPTYVYFPTCLARTMGTVAEDLRALCAAAGVGLELPAQVDGLCCGQPFASKGFPEVEASVRAQAVAALGERAHERAHEQIAVTDTATCAAHLSVAVLDPATFVATVLAPRLKLSPDLCEVWLHPTCADVRQGWDRQLQQAIPGGRVPLAHGCCGMAGDKGWSLPGLTAAATAREKHENGAARCVTTSPTCAAALGGEHLFTWLRRQLADQSLQ
jgi:D-lactate dehydrogenase